MQLSLVALVIMALLVPGVDSAMQVPDDFWFEQFGAKYRPKPSQTGVEAANAQGMLKISEKKWQEAADSFTGSIGLNRDNPVAFANRGSCFAKLERFEQARADFVEAARLVPQFGHMMTSRIIVLGLVSFSRNDAASCEQYADAALKVERTNLAGLTLRGTCRMMQAKLSDALTDLNEALELQPNFFLARYERAITNAMLGKCAEAAKDAEKVKGQRPAEYRELAQGIEAICTAGK